MLHLDIISGVFLVFLISSILLYVFTKANISFIVALISSGVMLGQTGNNRKQCGILRDVGFGARFAFVLYRCRVFA
jgi:hypothetical protein